MKWALVSEWLVEDPWQFVREVVERDWEEWRERGVFRETAQRRWRPVWQQNGEMGFSSPSEGFWVEPSSGLQRAREFVKAFRERGGDLHSAQRQHREMIFMPPYQPEHKHTTITFMLDLFFLMLEQVNAKVTFHPKIN